MVQLLCSAFFGMACGLLYDLYSLFISYCGCKKKVLAFWDLIFWLFVLCFALVVLLKFQTAQIRLAVLLWLLFGFFVYRLYLRPKLFNRNLSRRVRRCGVRQKNKLCGSFGGFSAKLYNKEVFIQKYLMIGAAFCRKGLRWCREVFAYGKNKRKEDND
ncbi:MAG: spore cortex biosynthesis protein YabQ [Clostridia bacterium]|nr:spore cortex biosynthesis protein YabQ [Clostridia bacterium]